jgi:manganese efflux pump family protein
VLTIFLLAFALAADAFAVALCQGAAARGPALGLALRVGFAFGAAQGLMPLIGWAVGQTFDDAIRAWDHWLAFGILLVLGVKLIGEGMKREADEVAAPGGIVTLAGLALATSLDAAAAGLAFDAMGLQPLVAASVIALVTGVLCVLAVLIGKAASARLGGHAELIGGAALIGIGFKILLDHGALAL